MLFCRKKSDHFDRSTHWLIRVGLMEKVAVVSTILLKKHEVKQWEKIKEKRIRTKKSTFCFISRGRGKHLNPSKELVNEVLASFFLCFF